MLKKLLLVCSLVLFGCAESPTENWQGISASELLKCGSNPNCVSSIDSRDKFKIEPLYYAGSPELAMERLVTVLKAQKRTEVVGEFPTRIHAIRKSAAFGFIDDMFFVLDAERNVINVHSSARSGYYDFGVNRRQMEIIRSQL